ncbi:MAG: sigma-70 family RNA polymerase sigma factor [Chloroflexota bacterium]|nr:sigma-70 family RNA polymerase sigma factor [Chloroflexota bacterium]
MTDQAILLAQRDAAPTAPVKVISGSDAIFRSRLEASLDGGYRLAAVILGDRRDAEDATHDAAERAWRSRSSLRDVDRFEPWFQRIVVNTCRDRMRRRRAAPAFVSVDAVRARGSAIRSADQGGDPYAGAVERDALRHALGQLNPDQRIVVAMRFYLDLEIEEIARRLATRPGTVKSRLHRALKQLRAAWAAPR